MAKLVKLTSKEGIVNKGNSFKCQCDEDIYVEPNSTVSLLNAHISSGILSSYNIDGTEKQGQDTGLAVASLYLTADKSDRERRVVCRNGDYDITSITQELTNAANKTLIFNSSAKPLSSTTDVYATPSNSDFGLQMMVGLAAGTESSKVSIMFNSSQQIATNLTFSAKNDGVNIDPATGNISYTNPVGQISVGLQTQLADQLTSSVTSTQDATVVGFAVGDSCNLVDSTNGRTDTVVITNIDPAFDNLATATNVTFVNAPSATTGIVTVDTVLPAGAAIPPEYTVDKIVTLDDGTSVANPVNNAVHGKIANATASYVNNNSSIVEISDFKGLVPTTINTKLRQFVDPNDRDQGVILGLPIPIGDAPSKGLEIGRFISIWTQLDGGGNLHATGEIADVVDDGAGGTQIIVNDTIQFTQGAQINAANCISVESYDVVKTKDNGGYDVQYIPSVDGTIGNFNGTTIACTDGITFLCRNIIENIENDPATVSPNFTNIITFQPKQLTCLDATGGVILTDKDAYFKFVSTINGAAVVLDNLSTIIIDKVQSEKVDTVANVNINDQDNVVIDTLTGTILSDLLISSQPFDFQLNATDSYVIFPIETTLADPQGYIYINNLFINLRDSANALFLIVNDATKQITLELKELDVPLTNTQVRLWLGYDIFITSKITLNLRGLAQPLNRYDLLIKGTLNKGAQQSFCVQDKRLSKSCGRAVFKVVTAGPCELGLISETPDFLSQDVSDNFVRVKIQNAVGAGGFIYTLWQGNRRIPLKRDIAAVNGDRVCVQWGVSPSVFDFEYNNAVNSGTNAGAVNAGSYFNSVGEIVDDDRQKMLFSVCRNGLVDSYFYLGATADAGDAAKVIPWTPRVSPYVEPLYYDNAGNYRIYVCPNQAVVRLVEITIDPTLTTVDGTVSYINGDTVIYDETLHGQDHPDLTDNIHRLESFANFWYWVWNDIYFQKQLGYKAPSQYINAAKGSFNATLDYLSAYLPENLVIFLDNIPSESYDLEKVKGGRRNIIGTCINTQGKVGEINVEPANLYKIALNNKQPINLRKFIVSFETFYGEQVILMSARAVVNLLFEPPK